MRSPIKANSSFAPRGSRGITGFKINARGLFILEGWAEIHQPRGSEKFPLGGRFNGPGGTNSEYESKIARWTSGKVWEEAGR